MIHVRQLCKQYIMGQSVVRALDGVDLDIAEGEMVSITGASGSGKSTLMHLIGCLDRPTSGSYEFAGQRVSGMNDRRLARLRNQWIGFVFQTFNLINRTSALENVCVPLIYGRKMQVKSAAKRALERVGLAARAHHKPNELSGGERQRVAIARAIVNEPKLLLADEPTGNLDSETGRQILDIFTKLNAEGVTVLLVTHEMAVAARAQRLIRMVDGKITDDRPIDSTLRNDLLRSHQAFLSHHEDDSTLTPPTAIAPRQARPISDPDRPVSGGSA